jgi:hypothetical protein
MDARNLSINRLKERVPYRIEEICDSGERVTLYIKEYNCPPQTVTILLIPRIAEAFRRVRELNRQKNGEAADIHLKYYGFSAFDGGLPIIRISGRNFLKYLG